MLNKGNKPETYCRICGFSDGSIRWELSEDNILTANFLICSCCGAEAGYEDCLLNAIIDYRKKWLEGGAQWFHLKEKPELWDLQKQLEQVPNEYK